MKFLLVILSTLIVLALSAEQEKSDVVVLTKANYDQVLKDNKFVFIEYYAPWCGHCKSLAPHYEKAATALKGLKELVVAKVDADSERDIGEKAGVQGFPTLKLYKDGVFYKDFEAARTSDAIIQWLRKTTGPPATLVKDQAALDAFLKDNTKTVVGFFESKESDAYKTFLKSIDTDPAFSSFSAVEVFDKELAKAQVSGVVPSYKLYRDFDEPMVLSGKDLSSASAWVQANGFPLVEEIGAENFQRYVDSGLKLAVAFLDKKSKDFQKQVDELTTIAKQVKGKISWGYSDGVVYKDQIKAMGADSEKLPAYAAMDIQKRLNYPFNGKVTVEALTKWSAGVADGTVEPFYKSQEVPKEQKEAVVVVVGKSFQDVVMDTTKDVLVEFYAPWCGHCKSLAPIYLKLAEELKGNKNLVIAKVDATENDTPVTVEGFPTIYYFPSNNKDTPVQYDGDRTQAAIQKWLKENAVASKDGEWPEVKAEEPAVEETTEEPAAEETEKKDEL